MEYAVFLRAINVGKRNRLKMDRLRTICDGLGFEGVRTYLQSGNVALTAADDAEAVALAIEGALSEEGLLNTPAMVRSREDLEAVVKACPFDAYDPETFRRMVTFYRAPIDGEVREEIAATEGVVAVLERELITATTFEDPRSAAGTGLDRLIGIPGTARYWHVAEAVLGLMAEE